MPKGVAKSGLRMTKQRLAAFAFTDPNFVKQYEEEKAKKQPLYVVQKFAEENQPSAPPSDEEITAKLKRRFDALDVMAAATARGMNRSLVISGPAGLGKSYGVDRVLTNLDKSKYRVRQVSGFVRLTGMYKMFYEMRHENCVIVFDDSDSVFGDDDRMNMLKAATDSKPVRKISWLSESRMETENGEALPREFEFHGSVIFITNLDLKGRMNQAGRLAPHYEALVSRSHYLDLGMKTKRDYLVRIRQVLGTGMLRNQGISYDTERMILSYIEDNQDALIELSLRMVNKIAELVKMSPHGWETLAEAMCLQDE